MVPFSNVHPLLSIKHTQQQSTCIGVPIWYKEEHVTITYSTFSGLNALVKSSYQSEKKTTKQLNIYNHVALERERYI